MAELKFGTRCVQAVYLSLRANQEISMARKVGQIIARATAGGSSWFTSAAIAKPINAITTTERSTVRLETSKSPFKGAAFGRPGFYLNCSVRSRHFDPLHTR